MYESKHKNFSAMILNYLRKYVRKHLRKNQLFVISNFQDTPGRSNKQFNTLKYTLKSSTIISSIFPSILHTLCQLILKIFLNYAYEKKYPLPPQMGRVIRQYTRNTSIHTRNMSIHTRNTSIHTRKSLVRVV